MHAPHKKLRLPEWYVSSLMMERALDAVVRDGKTIYMERHMHLSGTAAGTSILIAFGGKAAPGYRTAKLVIKLINSAADHRSGPACLSRAQGGVPAGLHVKNG